jgi:DNA helicase IV
MEYVSHVLPMLGEERVHRRALAEIVGANVAVTAADTRDAAAEKGGLAMAALIDKAVRAVPAAPDELVAVRLDGAEMRVYPDQLAQLVEEAVAGTDSIAAARERFRTELVRRLSPVRREARRRRLQVVRGRVARARKRRLPQPRRRESVSACDA